MGIVLSRIDNRLLHGIVASQWAPASGAVRLMVIDDEVANNAMAKSSMKLAKPAGMALSIITLETALTNFANNKYEGQSIFLIVKDPITLVKLQESGVKIPKLNIGGTAHRDNAKILSKRACATEEEINNYKSLAINGTNITIQFLLADQEVRFDSLVN